MSEEKQKFYVGQIVRMKHGPGIDSAWRGRVLEVVYPSILRCKATVGVDPPILHLPVELLMLDPAKPNHNRRVRQLAEAAAQVNTYPPSTTLDLDGAILDVQAKLPEMMSIPYTEHTIISKESKSPMSTLAIKLSRLADPKFAQELAELSASVYTNSDFQASLAKALKIERENIANEAADSVIKVIRNAKSHLEMHQVQIRRSEEEIERRKGLCKELIRAERYGMITSNFIPLALLAGSITPIDIATGIVTEVPKDWVEIAPTDNTPVISGPQDNAQAI